MYSEALGYQPVLLLLWDMNGKLHVRVFRCMNEVLEHRLLLHWTKSASAAAAKHALDAQYRLLHLPTELRVTESSLGERYDLPSDGPSLVLLGVHIDVVFRGGALDGSDQALVGHRDAACLRGGGQLREGLLRRAKQGHHYWTCAEHRTTTPRATEVRYV
jgi:hypothetical protein